MKPVLPNETVQRVAVNAKPALAIVASLLCVMLASCSSSSPPAHKKTTYSSFDLPSRGGSEPAMALGSINFQNADLEQVLAIYQELSGRTVIRGGLPRPQITVRNQTPMNRIQALQMLDTVLSEHGIAMVLSGELAVKAVPVAQAATEAPPNITLPLEQLPDSGSFMCRTVQLKNVKAVEVIPVLMPFVKAPNALLPLAISNQLIIRDYSANVRKMLQLLRELEKNPTL
ncbi:MAG: hypothetical protein NT154_31430 [Verrucomicrobia bacterium]|nr:hypothetical protein [Verrucomicrobiota bacterium]